MKLGRVPFVSVRVVLNGCSPACTLNVFSGQYGNFRSLWRHGGNLDEVRVDGRSDPSRVVITASSCVSFHVEVCEVSGAKYAFL